MNSVEHLVLTADYGMSSIKRYKTKYHEDLGNDIQKALEILEKEGWEVVTSFTATTASLSIPVLILKMVPR